MKRILTLALTAFILSGLAVSLLACGSESESPEYQLVTVQRGGLTVDITAVGNLAFAHKEELTFGVEGTVGEVLVEVGCKLQILQIMLRMSLPNLLYQRLKALLDQLPGLFRSLVSLSTGGLFLLCHASPSISCCTMIISVFPDRRSHSDQRTIAEQWDRSPPRPPRQSHPCILFHLDR